MIFTAGLQGFTTPRELRQLAQSLDADVIDVRKVLRYRRAGFGSNQLRAALEAGYPSTKVAYRHAASLGGMPRSERNGRTAAEAPTIPEMVLRRELAAYDPARFSRVHTVAAAMMSGSRWRPHALLVCLEHAPGDCHRHYTIGLPLAHMGVPVVHLYRGAEHGAEWEAFTADELKRAIEDDDDYACRWLSAYTSRGHVDVDALTAGWP